MSMNHKEHKEHEALSVVLCDLRELCGSLSMPTDLPLQFRKGLRMFRVLAFALVLPAASAAAQTVTLKAIPAPPDVAAAPADAAKAPSGLASKVMQPGTGTVHPAKDDVVMVHWTGWTTDGKMFDSSVARGKPNTFRLDRSMPGWGEGLQLLV